MTSHTAPPHPEPADLARDPHPLRGRVALVTGVSRRGGIGYAIARRLATYGASLLLHHYRPHDEQQPWGPDDIAQVIAGVTAVAAPQARVIDHHADLADPTTPRDLVRAATDAFGHLDILVCNHARSGGDGTLDDIDADMLTAHWTVNTRSALLLAKEHAAQHDGRDGGRVILMTSGQIRGAMPGEIAYASSKAALAGITTSLALHLAPRNITVNTVNPGPVQTGYITEDAWNQMRHLFPAGRVGHPDDPARLISWLTTDEARWVTGQVIATEGGFAL